MKTVLVTGGASGIGKALCEGLAASGLKVLVSDLDVVAAESCVQGIQAAGGNAQALELNVASQIDIDHVGQNYEVDILINNAGIQYVAKLEEFPSERWRLLNEVLLVGPAMLTRAVLPRMKTKNYGRIINIGSIHALVASPYKSAYVAAKHGLVGFAKTIALETGEFNITINTICPSYVKTPLVEKQIAQQAAEHKISESDVINNIMLEPMPKKAFIEMDELLGSVQFLISDSAKNMTGQTLVLDGGWTAR